MEKFVKISVSDDGLMDMTDLSQINRLEVIIPGVDRLLVEYGTFKFSLQDDGRTLKIFMYK